jgi:hypothetical protein
MEKDKEAKKYIHEEIPQYGDSRIPDQYEWR